MNNILFRCSPPGLVSIAVFALAGCATLGLDERRESEPVDDSGTTAADGGEPVTARNPAMDGPLVPRLRPGARVIDLPPIDPEVADVWSRLRDGFGLPDVDQDRSDVEIARYEGRQRYFEIVAQRAQP
jgi:hypothetical protein